MIVLVKDAPGDAFERGYLALRPLGDGTWASINEQPVESSEAAKQLCEDDLCEQLGAFVITTRMRLDTIIESAINHARQPEVGDRIRVRGHVCEVDAKGAITLPGSPRSRLCLQIEESRGDPGQFSVRAMATTRPKGQPLTIVASATGDNPEMFEIMATILTAISPHLKLSPTWGLDGSISSEPDL